MELPRTLRRTLLPALALGLAACGTSEATTVKPVKAASQSEKQIVEDHHYKVVKIAGGISLSGDSYSTYQETYDDDNGNHWSCSITISDYDNAPSKSCQIVQL